MNNKDEIKAYKKAINQNEKLLDKAKEKYEKDKAKANLNYIVFKGEDCYSEDDIRALYEADLCTPREYDKACEKLEYQLEQEKQIRTEAYYLIEAYKLALKNLKIELEFLMEEDKKWYITSTQI